MDHHVSEFYDGDLPYPDVTLQAFFMLDVHASTALIETVLSLMYGYWNMLLLTLPTQHKVWQLPNF